MVLLLMAALYIILLVNAFTCVIVWSVKMQIVHFARLADIFQRSICSPRFLLDGIASLHATCSRAHSPKHCLWWSSAMM